jgi:GxxExxY protein
MKPDTFVDDLKSLTYTVNGLAMRVHRELGMGCLEAVYKDALEYELRLAGLEFEREKEFQIRYRDTILKHKYYADFVVQDSLHIEVKAKKEILDEHYRTGDQLPGNLKMPACTSLQFRHAFIGNQTRDPRAATTTHRVISENLS